MNNILKYYSPQRLLNFSVFGIACFYMGIQAWNQSPITDSAMLLCIIGLISFFKRDNEDRFSHPQKIIITLGAITFLVSLLSWFFASYPVTINDLEPDLRFILIPVIMMAVIRAKLSIEQLAFAICIGALSFGASAIYQYDILGLYRSDGDENAVTFGNAAFLFAAMSAFILMSDVKPWLKWLAVVACVSATLAALYSGTRGSFLAILPLCALATVIGEKNARLLAITVIISAILAACFIPAIQTQVSRSTQSIENYFTHDAINTSIGQRIYQWEKAWCMSTAHPILGSGPRTFKEQMMDQESDCYFQAPNREGYFNQAHSLYFNTLATKGWLGLTTTLLFFIGTAIVIFRANSPIKYIAIAAVVTYLSYGISVDLLFKPMMADRHILLLGILAGIRQQKK